MGKKIKGAFPAKLSDQEGYDALLQHTNLRSLRDADGDEILRFADLVDGMVYTAGPARAAAESKQEQTWPEYVCKQVEKSVGHVILQNQRREGTCFLFKKERDTWFLLTNYHVAGGDVVKCQVKFFWSSDKFDAEIVFTHKQMDLAVLSIKTPLIAPEVEALTFSRQISKGVPLAVIGFHYEGEPKIQPGVCTGMDSSHNNYCVTTNAIVNSGDSGSPVVGTRGEVLGVAVASENTPDLQEADLIATINVQIFFGMWEEKERKKQQQIEMENQLSRQKIALENKKQKTTN